VIEHLLGRQGQSRRAQAKAMHLSDWKGWRQDTPFSRSHLRVGSGGLSLDIPAYLRPSKGKQLFLFIFACVAAAFGLVLIYCSQRLCHPAIIIPL